MFERFTDRTRRVLVLAQEEARLLGHDFVGTEHLLLGLIQEGQGVAARALESCGISLEAVRASVEETTVPLPGPVSATPPFTPRAKTVLELSLREALHLRHNHIGTEHLLLGIIREGEGVAARVLVGLGADLANVRDQVLQLLSGDPSRRETRAAVVEDKLSRELRHRAMEIASAGREGTVAVSPEHYLLAPLAQEESAASRLLRSFGVTTEAVQARLGETGLGAASDPQGAP